MSQFSLQHPFYLKAISERDEARAQVEELRAALADMMKEYKNGHVQVYQPEKWAEYKRLAGTGE